MFLSFLLLDPFQLGFWVVRLARELNDITRAVFGDLRGMGCVKRTWPKRWPVRIYPPEDIDFYLICKELYPA